MKKLLTTLTVIFCFAFAKAQYVNIPDSNFGKFLIAKYPSCLYKDTSNLYWMDTTCGAVVNEDSIQYIGWPLADSQKFYNLTGIQYFKNLKVLEVQKNLFATLPTLPSTLEYLDVGHNTNLTSLPQLPNGLKVLFCYQNALTALPQLPNSLENIDVLGNNLSVMPTLPTSLLILRTISNPLLKCLPMMPPNITTLYTDVPCILNKPASLTNTGGSALPPPVCNSTNNPNNCPIFGSGLLNYVNIPDSNFGKFLIQQYPSCLYKDSSNLYWMDTTCSGVVNEDSLDCSNKNISSIDGIQYFDNLSSLDCSHNLIVKLTLPKSPNNGFYLGNLDCSNNLIDTFPKFNTNIGVLICKNNRIKTFLGGKVEYVFNCSNNLIQSIDSISQVYQLVDFDCSHNKLSVFPSKLELSHSINCSNNLLSLPFSVNVDDQFICSNNKLSSLPQNIATNVNFIDCSNNLITTLTIPNNCKNFVCDSNNINSLTVLANLQLEQLVCRGNNLICLPKLPSTLYLLLCDTSKIKCLPNIPVSLTTTLPICNPTNNPNQCFIYPSVSGKVFTDNNSNGTKDSLEFYRPFVQFNLSNGQKTYSNLQGGYGISVDTFGSYTLKVTPPPYYKAVPDSVNITFAAGNTSLILPNIALQPIAQVDSFVIKHISLNRPRPGFKYAVNISYGNAGTINSATNNYILFDYDTSKLVFDSASVPVTHYTQNNAPVVFNAGNLVAGQAGSFNVYLRVKPSVAIGDSIKTAATVIYSNTKAFAVDSALVIGSYDPNDKLATPTLTPQQVQNGDYIDYTIRFQNKGTADAINIVIADTLSNLLQYNNIQVVATSHNSNISYRLANGIIYFEFLNINLPAAVANEPLSHGFVNFKVKALPTLAAGAIIPNTASIYFDYNAPVVTNTATTQIKAIVTPVRIINYELKNQHSTFEIQNNWTVGVEINVSHYVVQRSLNGRDFTSVGEVVAQGVSNYSFIDKLPITNDKLTIYYRLKIIDKDGKVSYSAIRNLELGIRNGGISITPNPSKGIVIIDVANAKELLINDYLGRTILTKQITNNLPLTINNLQKGVYLVNLIMNNGDFKASKLIVE